jgi:hypothetical protein
MDAAGGCETAVVCTIEEMTSRSTPVRIATITTLRDAGEVVQSFVRYQRAVGFDHTFLCFDDPADPAYDMLAGQPHLTLIRNGPELHEEQRATPVYDKFAPHFTTEVMARQNVNTAVVIARARAMGFEWLLHIDIDELLFVPGLDVRPLFEELDASRFDHAVFLNHEAVPEAEDIRDYFREVSLFKVNPDQFTVGAWEWGRSFWGRRGWYFNGYSHGKAAVRLAADPIPNCPHRFAARPPDRSLRTVVRLDAAVLHYQTCGLKHFVQKYRTLGRFGDKW